MLLPRSERGRAPWVLAATLLVLVVGLGVAWRQWQAAHIAALPPEAENDPLVRDGVVEQALGATSDSVLKTLWRDEVQGVDVSHLSEMQRTLFVKLANAQRCTCGCGYTLAGCRTYDPTCEVSLPRVEALLDSVRRGLVREGPDGRVARAG
jgi:hypothetical protein